MSQKESIEDYILGEQLGHGQFATVRLARRKHTDDVFAIKIIDLSKMTDKLVNESMVQQRVLNEVNIHRDRGLRHPSIVRCFNAFADGRNVYLVLEYCNMGTLKSYVENKKRLSEKEARSILSQIVDGLLVLHHNNIMHRDISMGNVLLTCDRQNNLQAKIADFGLAERLENPDMKHFTMCGTPNYMSPEVANGTGHGLETDIFSLGSVLYTMLVGGPPFESPDLLETINKIKAVLYKMPNLLSSKAQHLIMSVMRLNPNDRLTLKEIRDHPFLTGGSLEEFRIKYPRRNLCAEWSMDSGRGTCTTMSTVASMAGGRTPAPLPQSGYHQLELPQSSAPGVTASQSVRRSGLSATAPAQSTYPVTPQQLQAATPRTEPRVVEQNYAGQPRSANDCYYSASEARLNAASSRPDIPRQRSVLPSSAASAYANARVPPLPPDHSREPGTSQKSGDVRRLTPVLPRRMDRNQQLVEFTPQGRGGGEAGSGSPSSLSGSSCMQTPVMSDVSKDSSMSDEMQQLIPGGRMAFDDRLEMAENDTCSVASGYAGGNCGQLVHCSSETNLAAAVNSSTLPRQSHHRHHVGSQSSVIGPSPTPLTAEYAQQLRRRSRSADNLGGRKRQANGAAGTWSAVDIDINGQGPSEPTESGAERHRTTASTAGSQKGAEALPTPFNTTRLRPFRQQMNCVVYTILDDGCVCMEFFKTVNDSLTVVEVMRISADGLQIQIYKPNNGKGCMLGPQPPPVPPPGSVHLKHFTQEALPRAHWRKYRYASLFVSNIRAKTPKVTLYTRRAKFKVMENADVEVTFYDGAKYHRANDTVRIILRDGTIRPLETPANIKELSEEGQEMCQYVTEILQICTDMTNLLTSLQAHCGRGPDVSLFPIVVGRRPIMPGQSSPECPTPADTRPLQHSGVPSIAASLSSVNMSLVDSFPANSAPSLSTQRFVDASDSRLAPSSDSASSRQLSVRSALPSQPASNAALPPAASTSVSRPTSARSLQSRRSPAPLMTQSVDQRSTQGHSASLQPHGGDLLLAADKRPLCSVNVPGIGRASKYANGVVWLHYIDGSRLGIKVTPPSYIIDVSCSGQSVKYHADDELPDAVQYRVSKDLQVAMAQLNMLREA